MIGTHRVVWSEVAVVDPVSLIVGALAAGASSGFTDVATSAISDTYTGLRGLVQRLLSGRPAAVVALEEHANDPEGPYKQALIAELQRAGAGDDPEIVAAAQQLVEAVDPAGVQSGKYRLDLRSAQVGQVGDHNTAMVTFTSPPPRP